MEWETFEEEFGPLTVQKRVDWAAAMLMRQQAVIQVGDKAPPVSDFLPQWEREGEGAHIADWLSVMARKP